MSWVIKFWIKDMRGRKVDGIDIYNHIHSYALVRGYFQWLLVLLYYVSLDVTFGA